MTLGYIHTLGDSTLDNLFWMMLNSTDKVAKHNSVEGALQEQVKADGFEVISHAYDGFTTTSVLRGGEIGAVLPNSREKTRYMKLKAAKWPWTCPLADLQCEISANPNTPHYVVISIGGNDFRENLLNPLRLLGDIPQIQNRYLQIVDKVKALQKKNIYPILTLQYRTDANDDPYHIYPLLRVIAVVGMMTHVAGLVLLTAPAWIAAKKVSLVTGSIFFLAGAVTLYFSKKTVPLSITKDAFCGRKIGISMLGALLQSFYQPILKEAKKARLPILDLSNTFNPNQHLYDCGIEPNKNGSQLIAEGIQHIVKHHDFQGESFLYSKSKQNLTYTATANTNPSNWTVAYPPK